jgi:putative PIN family toxin of toxin-antitoxin system
MPSGVNRVFLDSNVIISGLLSAKGVPRIILDLLCLHLPQLHGMTGAYNMMEIERNLARKLPAALPVFQEYLPRMNLEIVPLPLSEKLEPWFDVTPDKDVPVIVSAVNGKADFLVTGDTTDFGALMGRDDLPLRVLIPADFVALAGELLGQQ